MISMSKITSKIPSQLTKSYLLNPQGQLEKLSGGQMSAGQVERFELANLQDFSDLLTKLKSNQALAYGCTDQHKAHIAKTDGSDVHTGAAIARSRKYFRYLPAPGILMLDYDPQPNKPALAREELLQNLYMVAPALQGAGYVWYPSSSSHICSIDTGEDLTGLRGQRLYFAVADASDIPRAGAALSKYLWAAGIGHFEVSAAGSLLKRTLFDTAVWQPERLDFAAGAACGSGLEQRRGKPVFNEGGLIDTLQDLAQPSEEIMAKAQTNEHAERERAKPAAIKCREDWLDRTTTILANKQPERNIEEIKQNLLRSLDQSVLFGDFILTVADGAERLEMTVGELLDNPLRYHAKSCLDPLEPEYNGAHVCGKLYLAGSRPILYSQAHGGKSYRLNRQHQRIKIYSGGLAANVEQMAGLIHQSPDVYNWHGELATIQEDNPVNMTEASLLMWAGENIQFYTQKKVKREGIETIVDMPKDPSSRLLQTALEHAT